MNTIKDSLFESVAVGSRVAANRFVVNPVERNNADTDGSPTDTTIDVYRRLAEGNWGIVIVESTTASEDPSHRGVGENGLLLNNRTFEGFRRLVEKFKIKNSETLLFLQLSPGNFGREEDINALSTEEIGTAQQALVTACILAEEAGFDGVDFKQCHDFLPARLLSKFNMRNDKWGGSSLNERSAFVRESIEQIRGHIKNRTGVDFIIGTRVSENDIAYLEKMIRLFETEVPFDFINISSFPSPYHFDANVLFPLSQTVKLMGTKLPVICSGGTDAIVEEKSLSRIYDLFAQRLAPDFIGFGRQSIADPLLPLKIKDDSIGKVRWCKKCSGCRELLHDQKIVFCKTYEEKQKYL